jgi:hypothetical protein
VLALATLIQAYTETAEFTAVQRLLEKIPPALQELPRIKAQIGLYYATQGDEKKARQYYQELQGLLDNFPPAVPAQMTKPAFIGVSGHI